MYPTDRDFLDIERLYTEDNINAVKEIFDIQVSHLESLLDVLKPARVYIVPPLPRQHKDIYKYYEKYNAAAYLLTLLMQDKLHNQIMLTLYGMKVRPKYPKNNFLRGKLDVSNNPWSY